MPFYNTIRLQALFWEIKNRFFYILLAFLLSFAVAYKKSDILLYLFVLSYTKKNTCFYDSIYEQIRSNKDIHIATLLNDDNQNTRELKVNDFFSNLSESFLIHLSKTLNAIDISSIKFIFTDVEEAFSSQISVCFIFSFLAIFPFFIYNILSFFVPSLYFYESKKWINQSFLFFFVWYSFLFAVQNTIIPKISSFLLEFQITSSSFSVVAETKIYSYCNWASTIFILANFIFFFIYLIFFLITNDKVKIRYFALRRKQSSAVLLLVSALIAPPDLFIQFLLTLFLISCFEVFLFVFFIYKHFLKCFTL